MRDFDRRSIAASVLVRMLAAVTCLSLSTAPVLASEPSLTPPLATAGLEVVPASAPDILAAVRGGRNRATIVNLWATWCTPCREEFPDLMRFYNAYKDRGVSLVLVSGDFSSDTEAAREFLATQGVGFRTYLKSGKDDEFINSFDPAWSGALPATFVYNDRGERVHSFLGTVTYDSLEREVVPLVGATPVAAPPVGATAPATAPALGATPH
jgi:thiol-disulfide isomerase/thioredoxin